MSQLQADSVAVSNISAPADAVEMVQGVLLGGGGSRDGQHVTGHRLEQELWCITYNCTKDCETPSDAHFN